MGLLQNIIDRALPGKRDRSEENLERYTAALLETSADLHRLSRMLPYLIVKTMKLENASFAAFDPAANNFRLYSAGKEIEDSALGSNSALVVELLRRRAEISLSTEKDPELIEEMKRLAAILTFPGFTDLEKLLMILNLGKHESGRDFSSGNIDYFKKYMGRILSALSPSAPAPAGSVN